MFNVQMVVFVLFSSLLFVVGKFLNRNGLRKNSPLQLRGISEMYNGPREDGLRAQLFFYLSESHPNARGSLVPCKYSTSVALDLS